VIGRNVQIGEHVRVGASATVSHAHIGDHSRLYTGVRIGQDGFGFAIDPRGHVKVPQLGRVIIEGHVEIGANTCIDRGAGPDTVIGQGTWIDNLVQIGHNVRIGRGCIIVSQVGIAGSTVLEDFVAIGGQGGISGHLHIGQGARIAAGSGVIKDIPAGEEQMGYPAQPIRDFMKQVAFMKRLIKKNKEA
jgi:UDP-3-O-[3-hydroxymyristoyl] glucosamine N-acyltransferase